MSSRQSTPRVDPIRRTVPLIGAVRAGAVASRDRLLAELDGVDAQLTALARRRIQLTDRLAELRDELWPVATHPRGRRPAPSGELALPPLPEQPTWLEGRRLRSVCLVLLRRVGRLSLPRLHALLHAHGYGIDSAHATKALSDALSYEVECGRARRVRRGEYEVGTQAPKPGRHGAVPLRPLAPHVDDRLLDPVLSPTTPLSAGNVDERCS